MAVTARDVALVAGVSPATVSLVFRNKPGVGEKTRQRVFAVAQELGFEYRGSASDEKKQGGLHLVVYKSHGKVVGDTAFFAALIEGVKKATYAQGFGQLNISYFYERESVTEQIRAIKTSKCAGIILLATELNANSLRPFRRLKIPIVLLDSWFPTKDIDSVIIDNQGGAYNAVEHLVSMGHTKIGYLHSKVRIRNFVERADGYRQACQLLIDRHYDSQTYTVGVGASIRDAYADMTAWLLKKPELPTAFFADNDLIAAGCMTALIDAGYQVPRDVSIVGFDNVPIKELGVFRLSSMDVPKERIAALAVERLARHIQRGERTETIRISVLPTLVARDSVAPPQGA
jgi:LacI family transcriptional regulator